MFVQTAAPVAVIVLTVLFARRHRPRPLRLHLAEGGAVEAAQAPEAAARRALFQRTVLIALGLVALVSVAGPLGAAVAITAAGAQPRLAAARGRRRRAAAIAAAYPDFVDLLVLTVRAGCTPVQAFNLLAATVEPPIRAAVADVDRRVDGGARFADAVGCLPVVLGPIAQPLSDGLALADRHGTPLAEMLDRLAADARSQRRRNAETAARQLPIRLSFPLVGCTLPSFVLLTIVPLMAGTLSSLHGLRR